MGTNIAPEDLTWLLMDQPRNLMHVNSLAGFDELPSIEAFTELMMERIVRKYEVLSQVPVERNGDWFWEDDPDFAIERHVRRVTLADSGDDAVRAHVSKHFAMPFDRAHPLWEMQLLSGPDGDGTGGYLYSRFHHGIGDGIRLVQLLIGMCDPVAEAVPDKVGLQRSEHHHPLDRVRNVVGRGVSDTIDYVSQARDAVATVGRTLISTTNPRGLKHHAGDAIQLVRNPVRLIDALTGIASIDNETTNSWREIGRLLLSDGHDAHAWSGRAGVEKSVAWIEGIPLAGIRAAAKAHGVTINDVLVAGVSIALTDYLGSRGVDDVSDLSWMMPVSLQPVDAELPADLGNHFVVVMLSMPLGIRDPSPLLEQIHERTTRLKHSAEPLVAFGVQRVIAETPPAIARGVTEYFAGKTIGQLSNVPGPRVPMKLAGAPVRSVLGWVPTSGDQPLGICVFSYAGSVNVGVATDARMLPDPGHLVRLVELHLGGLVDRPFEVAAEPPPRPPTSSPGVRRRRAFEHSASET